MTTSKAHRPKPTRRHQRGMEFARNLMLEVCRIAGSSSYLRRLRYRSTRAGLKAAVATHDTPALYDWLMEALSYQGVSDSVAWHYMEEHGGVHW